MPMHCTCGYAMLVMHAFICPCGGGGEGFYLRPVRSLPCTMYALHEPPPLQGLGNDTNAPKKKEECDRLVTGKHLGTLSADCLFMPCRPGFHPFCILSLIVNATESYKEFHVAREYRYRIREIEQPFFPFFFFFNLRWHAGLQDPL